MMLKGVTFYPFGAEGDRHGCSNYHSGISLVSLNSILFVNVWRGLIGTQVEINSIYVAKWEDDVSLPGL